jgi:Family of unknown function (DUF5681)
MAKFLPGQSGNPGGRPKALVEVLELARKNASAALETIVSIMTNADAPHAVRLAAANSLLDRALGRPAQALHHSGEDEPTVNAVDAREIIRQKLERISEQYRSGQLVQEPPPAEVG